jgi:hypothetical protein
MCWEIYVSRDDCPVGVGCPFAWTELRPGGALSFKRSLQSAGDISCMVIRLPCEVNDPSRRVVARGCRILINGRELKL